MHSPNDAAKAKHAAAVQRYQQAIRSGSAGDMYAALDAVETSLRELTRVSR